MAEIADDRIFLGTWDLPSGNSVEAWMEPFQGVFTHVEFEWKHVPAGWAGALQGPDAVYYREVILPEATQATLPHTKKPPPEKETLDA